MHCSQLQYQFRQQNPLIYLIALLLTQAAVPKGKFTTVAILIEDLNLLLMLKEI